MEIKDIKQQLTIQTVLNHYKLKTDRHNMLKCPFHADDKPSMKVYTNTNTFNCFGCGKNGDQIEFIQLKENCSKHKALVKAAELCNDIKPTESKPIKSKPMQNYTDILTRIFESPDSADL